MENDAHLQLRDANIMPTNEIIANCLGSTYDVYQSFIEELKNDGIFLMDWRYYQDGKAWLSKGEYSWITSRGTKKVKTIFWVSIWNTFFKISFNFPEKTKEKLLALPIHENTKSMIENIIPNGEKRKFLSVIFNVHDDVMFNDILIIAQFRKTCI